jgi:hypothetical protein
LVPCYKHSSPPPTIPGRNPGKPHTPTINITDQMPTLCTNAPPSHHAHLGSLVSRPPMEPICLAHMPNIFWKHPHHTHTKSTYTSTPRTQHFKSL